MMVAAHPDDDAYGMAGTVALHADDPGFRFVLVHATDGGAGDIAPDFPATRETLGALRREEDERAWRALGRPPDRHEWLGYEDGAVSEVPFDELVDRLAGILEEERPDVVGSFGPDGITGHPDHVTVGAATDAAFDRVAASGGEGLQRLVHGAMPQSVFQRWNDTRRRKGHRALGPGRGLPPARRARRADRHHGRHLVGRAAGGRRAARAPQPAARHRPARRDRRAVGAQHLTRALRHRETSPTQPPAGGPVLC